MTDPQAGATFRVKVLGIRNTRIGAAFLLGCAGSWCAEEPVWRRLLSEAARLQGTGEVRLAAGEYARALREARTLGPAGPAAASVLFAAGAFYDDIGDTVQAQADLEESLRLWRAILGRWHIALARLANRLATVYIETGNLGKAERLDLGQWVDRLRNESSEGEELALLLQNLGNLESLRGRPERGAARYEEALERIRGASGLRAAVLNDYGLACLRAKQRRRAVELLGESVALWEKLRGADSVQAGLTAYNLGLALEAAGRLAEADERMEAALRIAEERLGPGSLRTAEVLRGYAGLLKKLHRTSEARQMAARADKIRGEQGSPSGGRYTVDVADLERHRR